MDKSIYVKRMNKILSEDENFKTAIKTMKKYTNNKKIGSEKSLAKSVKKAKKAILKGDRKGLQQYLRGKS